MRINDFSPPAEGVPGDWIVAGLDDGSGHLVVVLRGWVPSGAEVPAPQGPVTVLGRVHTDQNFYAGSDPTGSPQVIVNDRLEQYWQQPVRAGYLVLEAQSPVPGRTDPAPVPPVFGLDEGAGIPWQNFGYALQWIIFIGFVVFVWLRWFREDLRDAGARQAAAEHVDQPA